MRRIMIMLIAVSMLASLGCTPTTPEEKVKQQLGKVHALTAEERQLAQTNAKQFYEKEWPVQRKNPDGTIEINRERGFYLECRPSDSNSNGLVTCVGKVPQINGGFADVKRYCGYAPELVGCSDEDTVK